MPKLTRHPSSYDVEFVLITGSTFTDKLLINHVRGASVSSLPTPQNTPSSLPSSSAQVKTGDVNDDEKIDIIDTGIVIDNYGKNPIPNPKSDLNKDGVVNIIDVGIIIDNYGK